MNYKEISKESAGVFIVYVIGLGFNYVFNLYAAKLAGADEFGKLTYLFTLIFIQANIFKVGLDVGLVHFLPNIVNEKFKSGLILSSLALCILANVILGAVIFYILDISYPNFDTLIAIVVQVSLSSSIVFKGVFRSIGYNLKYIIGNQLLSSIVKVMILYVLYSYDQMQYHDLLYCYLLSSLIENIYYVHILKSRSYLTVGISQYIGRVRIYMSKVIMYSLPLLMVTLLNYLTGKLDILFLENIENSASVGRYAIASKLGTMSSYFLMAANMVLGQSISILYHKRDITQLNSLYKKFSYTLFLTSTLCFLGLLVFGKFILGFFGEEYVIAYWAMIVISLGQILNSIVGPAGNINVLSGNQSKEITLSLIVLPISLLSNYLLIYKYGIIGAAFANMIVIGSINLLRFYYVYKKFEIHPFNKKEILHISSITICFILYYYNYMVPFLITTIISVSYILIEIYSTIIQNVNLIKDERT